MAAETNVVKAGARAAYTVRRTIRLISGGTPRRTGAPTVPFFGGKEDGMQMFDEEISTTIKADGTVEQQRWVIEDTLQSEEMEEAQAAFLVAEKKFRALDSDPEAVTDKLKNLRWWNALEALYVADKRLWELFTGKDRSVKSNQMYNAYSERLIRRKRLYRADA